MLAQREAAARAFSPALALGVLSAREVLQAARRASDAPLSAADAPLWGRSSEGCAYIHAMCICMLYEGFASIASRPTSRPRTRTRTCCACTRHAHAMHTSHACCAHGMRMLCRALADVAEWREWFELLARRSLDRQAQGLSTGLGEAGGDERATPIMGYWRWGGTHLTRCAAAPRPHPRPHASTPPRLHAHATSRHSPYPPGPPALCPPLTHLPRRAAMRTGRRAMP